MASAGKSTNKVASVSTATNEVAFISVKRRMRKLLLVKHPRDDQSEGLVRIQLQLYEAGCGQIYYFIIQINTAF